MPQTPHTTASSAPGALQLHDARPFLDKALAHGVLHGILNAAALEAIHAAAPKGIVQIARYFGSEFLRPELEKARDRMVNMVSIYLQDSCHGDLTEAAKSLRDHSFLSRSKGGSDMLKRLIAMPESSNFGMAGYDDAETALLALWTLRSYSDYQVELARRQAIAQSLQAAQWLAEQYDLEEEELEAGGADAEAVIRVGLLLQALNPRALALGEWPDAASLGKLVTSLRAKKTAPPTALRLPTGLPAALRPAFEVQIAAVLDDAHKLLTSKASLPQLLRPMGVFRARYFLLDDPLAEVDAYHRSVDHRDDEELAEPPQPASKTWTKLTDGNDDEPSLLTLFLCLATGVPRKTLLTEKTAASLVRKLRKHGWQPALANDFIAANAPGVFQAGYLALWAAFVQEASSILTSDRDYELHDALALLRRECNVAA